MNESQAFSKLCDTIRTLVDPVKGCPWDKEQTFSSLRKYMIEEAYEAAHAATLEDPKDFVEELGDVLLQVILNAAIAEKKGLFQVSDVLSALDNKMQRRHPHVFTDPKSPSMEQLKDQWNSIKEREGKDTGPTLDKSIPATLAAVKIGQKCPDFDWASADDVLEKVEEELNELKVAMYNKEVPERLEEELGDTFFSLCQLARWLELSPEVATSQANHKFLIRYRRLRSHLDVNKIDLKTLSEEQKQDLWQKAKGY